MRTITASAPVRICDAGGWTDTWFARHGLVCSIAVSPRVHVAVRAWETAKPSIEIHAVNYGLRYTYDASTPAARRIPLIDGTLTLLPPPPGTGCAIEVSSEGPAGASTGTSAALTVALAGALSCLRGSVLEPHEAATLAHRVETGPLGRQSGVQDHIAAAYGGINLITIDEYPHARVERLPLSPATVDALGSRLLLLYLGRAHESSAVHEAVIAGLSGEGADAPALADLREAAAAAADALRAGDLEAYGRALQANTEAQRRLHAALVGDQAQRLIRLAAAHGASGWKVNGAGGDGGSLSVLCGPDPHARRALEQTLAKEPGVQIIPIAIDFDGLRVTSS